MKGLHLAAYNADAESVRAFLRLGADPNQRDDRGYTPLLWAALRGAVGIQVPVVTALIEAGADPNAVNEGGDSTVLMWAAQAGNLDVIRAIVKGGGDVNRAANEVTPLMVAAGSGDDRVVQLLLDCGANPAARAGRFTAADYAEHRGYADVARIVRSANGVSDSREGVTKVVDFIELHDSVVELRRDSASVVLLLLPAYVHHWQDVSGGWVGTGRTQNARIEIGCRTESVAAFGPIEVSGGSLRVGDSRFDNMIPVPMETTSDVTIHLELVDGTRVTVDGRSVRIELAGPAIDVEPLPPDWAPQVDVD